MEKNFINKFKLIKSLLNSQPELLMIIKNAFLDKIDNCSIFYIRKNVLFSNNDPLRIFNEEIAKFDFQVIERKNNFIYIINKKNILKIFIDFLKEFQQIKKSNLNKTKNKIKKEVNLYNNQIEEIRKKAFLEARMKRGLPIINIVKKIKIIEKTPKNMKKIKSKKNKTQKKSQKPKNKSENQKKISVGKNYSNFYQTENSNYFDKFIKKIVKDKKNFESLSKKEKQTYFDKLNSEGKKIEEKIISINTLSTLNVKEQIKNRKRLGKLIFEKTNNFLLSKKKNSLEWSEKLFKIALEHSKNMALKKTPFGHKDFINRSKEASCSYNSLKENVAYISNNSDNNWICDNVLNGWIQSPGHYKNIMAFNHVTAIASYFSESKNVYYFTQLFACY